jgi:predicted metalloprotease with PDZ domain
MTSLNIFKGLLALATLASAQGLPSMNVNVAPIFNGSDVQSLNMTLKIVDSRIKANASFLSIPGWRYDISNPLTATDDKGALPIAFTQDPKNGMKSWSVSRDPIGSIKVNFNADPDGDVDNLSGRSDLRYDQGGVFGQFQSFIPIPQGDENWEMTISWDIPSSAPKTFHYVSSINGEDVQGKTFTGVPLKTLRQTVLALGEKLQRWPAWGVDTRVAGGHDFAIYYMHSIPWKLEEVAPAIRDIFNGTANYFGDRDSPFRVFFRRDFRAYGGVGAFQAFLVEYHLGSEEENSADSLALLLSHEIVHSYANFWPENGEYDNWYVEGVADYLSFMSPFISGAINRTHWIRWFNDQAQDYYTGGSNLNATWDKVVERYWTLGTYNIKTAYTRGSWYLAYVQGLIHDATNGAHTVDEVIKGLYKLYRDGKNVGKEEFLQLLGNLIGRPAADASWETMRNGTTLVPSKTAYAQYDVNLVRHDLPTFDLGMSENSLGQGRVIGLKPGSMAAKAGLRENDTIVDFWGIWGALDTQDNKMRIGVNRNGTRVQFDYLPRNATRLSECYQLVDATA